MNCHEVAALLDAYVDDEIRSSDGSEVRDHLAGCDACRLQLQRLESLRRLLHTVPYNAAPDSLRARIVAHRERQRITWPRLGWAAAVVLAAAAGLFALRFRELSHATTVLATDAVTRHVAALMADRVFEVRSTSQHTVKPWFQGRLDFSPPVPDLEAGGFTLVGGRTDTLSGMPVAALVYRRRDHVIDVFISPDLTHATGTDTRTIRGFQERHWRQSDMSLWAVSDLNDRELGEFVQAFEAAGR